MRGLGHGPDATTRSRTSSTLVRRIRAAVPDAHILVVDDSSPDGTADKAEALGAELGGIEVLRRPAQDGARQRVPRRPRDRHRARLRRDGPDRRRPLARPGRAPRAARRGRATAPTSRSARATCRAARCRTGPSTGSRCRCGATATPRSCSACRVRDSTAGYRAYRASILRAMDFETTHSTGYTFQIEMTYRVAQRGRADRRGADRVHRPRARHVEDVVPHRRRGDDARDVVGSPRPGAAAAAADRG